MESVLSRKPIVNLDSYDIFIQPNYFHVVHQSDEEDSPVYCLIHGWIGNELSMSVFSSTFTQFSYAIYPRAPFKITENHFGWVDINEKPHSTFTDYAKVSKSLYQSLIELLQVTIKSGEKQKINLIGFSQGAAVCTVLSVLYPETFTKTALLAGFLPDNPPLIDGQHLVNSDFYIAHGKQDQTVEFQKAVDLQNYLNHAGANTTLCVEELGHKVGRQCMQNLKTFFGQ